MLDADRLLVLAVEDWPEEARYMYHERVGMMMDRPGLDGLPETAAIRKAARKEVIDAVARMAAR